MGRVRNPIIWSAVATLIIGGSMLVHYRRAAAAVEIGHEASTEALLVQLEQAAALYRADYDRYPESLDELLGQGGRGRPPYFEFRENGVVVQPRLLDPWGRPLVYRVLPRTHSGRASFQLYSMGPNGIDEGGRGDDIGSQD